MIKKNIILITYDYPCKCTSKEYLFIRNDLDALQKSFEKIIITPIKIPKNQYLEINKNDNVVYDFTLAKKFLNPISIFFGIFFTFINLNFFKELFSLRKFSFKKIKMIFVESITSEIIRRWLISNYNNFEKNIFYSFWSSQVLLSFYIIKKKFSNFKCFARTLGSDINGFITNDDFVPFIKLKFKLLNFVFILIHQV